MAKDIFLCFPFENLSLVICRKFSYLTFLSKCCHMKELLLKPGPGPWTRTLKNRDPEKPGISIGLKNMSDFRELCFIKTMRNVIY